MPNRWIPKTWLRAFTLALLAAMVPLFFGVGAVSDESLLAGAAVDFDDDLRAEMPPVTLVLTSQGPVVNRVLTRSILLSSIPFHPPA